MDRVTFDFETGEVTFAADGQQGTEFRSDLQDRKAAIMAAAGYEAVDMKAALREVGLGFLVDGFTDGDDALRQMQQALGEDDT